MGSLRQDLPGLFDNPAPAADAPRVRLSTSAGDIVVALYADRAPQHVENFLKRSRDGQYDGTKFHRTIPGFMIQGGDTNSIEGAPETWGTGDAGYTIPQEFSDLVHHRGYLAAAKRGDQVESGGAQFYITVGTPHHLDGVHTVFGKVVEGLDVVDDIATAPIAQGTQDRPAEPVTLTAATVL
jgi:cyclophilin family peptidyl-prolyl cis-trans isomerase